MERNRETLLIERMKKILITGAGSYVGESVRKYILSKDSSYQIDAVDTMDDNWKKADYTSMMWSFMWLVLHM